MQSRIAPKSPGHSGHLVDKIGRVQRELNQDAASSSQVLQKDAEMDKSTRRLEAAEENQELLNFHEHLESTRKLVASGNSDINGIGTIWQHNLHISAAHASHLEKVLSNVRQRYGRKRGDKAEDLDVDAFIWRMSIPVSLQAAVSWERLCREFTSIKNQPKRTLEVDQGSERNLFIEVINWKQVMWQRTTLLTDKAVQFATAKINVFFRLVLCVGGIRSTPVNAWKKKINCCMNSRQYREMDRIDGEPMEFEWTLFPGFTTLQILVGDSENDDWHDVRTWAGPRTNYLHGNVKRQCMVRNRKPRSLCCEFSFDCRLCLKIRARTLFLGLGLEKKWYGTHIYKPNVEWDDVADIMMINFSESGRPVFSWIQCFGKRRLEEQRKRKIVYTFQWQRRNRRRDSSYRYFPSISSVYEAVADTREKSAREKLPNVRRVQGNP